MLRRSSGSVAICKLSVFVAPLVAGAITVDLDSVAVRVGQVQRLGDQVIRGAVQRPPRLCQPDQRVGQIEA